MKLHDEVSLEHDDDDDDDDDDDVNTVSNVENSVSETPLPALRRSKRPT